MNIKLYYFLLYNKECLNITESMKKTILRRVACIEMNILISSKIQFLCLFN